MLSSFPSVSLKHNNKQPSCNFMTMTFPITLPSSTKKFPFTDEASIGGSDSVISKVSSETTTANSPIIDTSGPKKRYMIIDETKLPRDEAERLIAKRAYNRQCAERARKRSKETVKELLQQVQELHADKVELRRILAMKEEEIKLLQENCKALLLTTGRVTTQGANIYPHHSNIGSNIDTMFLLKAYSPEQPPFSALLLSQWRSNNEVYSPHDISASLLPTWNRH
jgi:hypothetical protein